MKLRRIGKTKVSEVGMGCMAFSHGYGRIPEEQYSIEAIRNAYDHGCTFFDTAEVYSPGLSGRGHNKLIVGKALKDVRDHVAIATKFMPSGMGSLPGGSLYKNIRKHLIASLERLQTDYVDVYYLHRTNGTSIENVAEAMGRLIDEGLIGGWGLSQVDVDEIDRAQRITPLAAVQNIYSMVERYCEEEVIPYCMEHGIAFVPFSPIASGQLSGRNIEGNMPIVDLLKKYADQKDATPAQITLAWMLHKYPNVIPIPGSKNKDRIIENLGASDVELTEDEFRSLEGELNQLKVCGHRGLGGF